MTLLDDVAEAFLQIHLTKSADPQRSFDMASLTIEDAYEVQRRVIAARVERGEKVVGHKVGCTGRAIRRQFGAQDLRFSPENAVFLALRQESTRLLGIRPDSWQTNCRPRGRRE